MVSFLFILDNFLPTRKATASIQRTQEGELSDVFLSLTGQKKFKTQKQCLWTLFQCSYD